MGPQPEGADVQGRFAPVNSQQPLKKRPFPTQPGPKLIAFSLFKLN